MIKVVESRDIKFHSTDRAIEVKLNCTGIDHARTMSKRERACGEILGKRDYLRRFPEVNAEGRTASYDYLGVKRWYDQNGVDEDGFYADGESATEGEFNRDGWRYEKWPGERKRLYNREGRDIDGRDGLGYSRRGYNRNGTDCYGFNRNGIHAKTGTERDENGYNRYGVNEEGYTREGKIHEAVALARQFLEIPGISFGNFAKDKGISRKEVESTIDLAKKVMPSLGLELCEHAKHVAKRRWNKMRQDRDLLKNNEINLRQFWERNPDLDFSDLVRLLGPEELLNCTLREMGGNFDPKNPEAIHVIAHATNSTTSDALSKRVAEWGRELSAIGKGRDLTAIRQFVKSFYNTRVDLLLGGSFSIDGGKTMVKITDGHIQQAKQKLKENNGLICQKTVYYEIVNTYRR